MSFMSQKCIEQLTQQGVIRLLPLVVQWIAGREFKRVNGTPADVVAYDAAAQTAFADAIKSPTSVVSFSGGAATDAFSNAIVEFFNITAQCPGWNEANCSFNWGEFACFCAAAVPFDPALIIDLGKTQPANEPIAYECNPAVKSDPVYKTASTGGGGVPLVISTDKDTGYGWKTWAIGGAAAVGLGVAGYMVYGRKHSKPPQAGGNPSHHHYTLAELEAMPTLEHGHFDNLKIETPTTRVWLSRMTKADGAPYENEVSVDHYRNGRWETVDRYQAW